MADYDRWGGERYRRGGRREEHRFGPEPDRFTRFDRESFGRGERGGRGHREFPGGRGHYDDQRGDMGGRGEPRGYWATDDRGGYGDDRHPGRGQGWDEGGRMRDREAARFGGRDAWRGEDHGGERRRRSMGEMAFGREQGGRDDPAGFGRRDERDERGWFDRMGEEVASWFGGEHEEDRLRRLDLREGGGTGGHRGRGPKSYQRSDERILEDINDRLTDDPQLDASDIEVSVSGREATLSGTVSSRYDKRRAEDLADSVSGVTHVQNNLRVRGRGAGQGWSDERVENTTEITGVGSLGGGPGSASGPRS